MGKNMTSNGRRFSLQKVAATGLVISMLFGAPTIAYANVPNDNITGDIMIGQDRSAQRVEEANAINAKFSSQVMPVSTIAHALELSDVLNGYNPGPNEFSNTSYGEIMGLDLEGIYGQYQGAVTNGTVASFCQNNMFNEAAIDAYTTFGCKTIVDAIYARIAEIAQSQLQVGGRVLTESPRVGIDGNRIYVVLNYGGRLVKFDVTGSSVEETITLTTALMNHYYTAINNAAGYSSSYENSFAYQGAYNGGNDSAYFSAGDDDRKDEEKRGIEIYGTLTRDLSVSAAYATPDHRVDAHSAEILRNMGYTEEMINSGIQINLVVEPVLTEEIGLGF